MKNRFMLISGERSDHWSETLSQALSTLGSLEITTQAEAGSRLKGNGFAVVIIDAASVTEPERLTADLVAEHPDARVVVVTYSPTWRRANEAMKAGAMDYMPKTLIKEELRNRIEAVMHFPSRSSARF